MTTSWFVFAAVFLTRLLLLIAGGAVIVWGAVCFPPLSEGHSFEGFAGRIVDGESFKTETLDALRPQLDQAEASPSTNPKSLRAAAIIELRLAELETTTGHRISDNEQFARARKTIRDALCLLPTDSFLWFALAWIDKTENGYSESIIPFLRQSYLTGAHEGWIAAHRNGFAVSLVDRLPDDLKIHAITEFRDLVESNFTGDAASVLIGSGWAHSDALLASLKTVPLDARRALADTLYDRDVDITVPGIERVGARRPWR